MIRCQILRTDRQNSYINITCQHCCADV